MINVSRWRIILVVLATLFGVLFTLPNLLSPAMRDRLPGFLPKQALNLGLDLQGGSYLLYEVDTQALRAERLTNLVEDIRTQMREESIDFTGLGVVAGEVTLRINDPAMVNVAVKSLRDTIGSALAGATGGRDVTISIQPDQRLRVAFVPEAFDAQAAKAVEQSIEVIRRRIDELGTKEPDIRRQGKNRIMIAAPGESDPEKLKAIIGQTAKLTFQMVDETADLAQAQAGRVPPGSMLIAGDDFQPFYVVKRR